MSWWTECAISDLWQRVRFHWSDKYEHRIPNFLMQQLLKAWFKYHGTA